MTRSISHGRTACRHRISREGVRAEAPGLAPEDADDHRTVDADGHYLICGPLAVETSALPVKEPSTMSITFLLLLFVILSIFKTGLNR